MPPARTLSSFPRLSQCRDDEFVESLDRLLAARWNSCPGRLELDQIERIHSRRITLNRMAYNVPPCTTFAK